MQIVFMQDGSAKCIYGEEIDLSHLGQTSVQRGSYVEPNSEGKWSCDLSPVGGPQLGPFACRSQAISAEVEWLTKNWLVPPAP